VTAAKVLRLKSTGEIVALDDGPSTIALCQRAIRATSLKFKDIASAAGVCDQTVANIAYGDTKSPRMSTVVRILMALGWSIYASKHHA
jgi:predicted transcriptional regulator